MLGTASEKPIREQRCPRVARRESLNEARLFIEAHYSERITLGELALVVGLSVYRFVTVFRRETGMSPHRYLCAVRVRVAQDLLQAGVPPAIAAIEAGFFDQSHLCRHFRAVCGMTPRQFLATRISIATPFLHSPNIGAAS